MEIFIVIAVLLGLCFVVFCYWLWSKKTKKAKKEKTKKQKKVKEQPKPQIKKLNMSLVDKFMYRKELLFWKYLVSILPKSYVCLPKVSLISIVSPDGDKNLYNEVIDRTLDIVIFDENTMHPVLTIDVYDNSYEDERIDERDPKLALILEKLELKVVYILMKLDFDREAAKRQIFEALNIQTEE
ncbi:MAG: DUF2726 domain-containing protein [Clostridia bacterium]|nr:DUF2726 domain-containing protein [Clostridia bacterium]